MTNGNVYLHTLIYLISRLIILLIQDFDIVLRQNSSLSIISYIDRLITSFFVHDMLSLKEMPLIQLPMNTYNYSMQDEQKPGVLFNRSSMDSSVRILSLFLNDVR